MKLIEVAKEWFESKKGLVKESTLSVYYYQLKTNIYPYWGGFEVESFKKADAQLFISKLFQRGLSMKSVKDAEIVLKQIILYAVDTYDINVPCQFTLKYPTKNLAQTKEEIQVYTVEEMKMIANYFRSHPSSRTLGIIMVLCTGMRIGEICGLRWEDIDFNQNLISIARTVERITDYNTGKTKVVIQSPKTINSQRKIPFSDWLKEILLRFQAPCLPHYYVLSGSEDLIEPRNYRTYYKRLLLEKVGLRRCLKFHGMRHTFATNLIVGGSDVKSVSSLLGHSTVNTTLNLYTHSSIEDRRKCIESIQI